MKRPHYFKLRAVSSRVDSISAGKPSSQPCRLIDPLSGSIDLTLKFGPEVQLGPVKAGTSFYKNLMTGGSGAKLEANAGLVSIQADSPTPDGGSFGSGGPGGNQYSASILGFQYDFKSGTINFDPSKSFTIGAQFLFGAELSFNSDRFRDINSANATCQPQTEGGKVQ